MENRFSKDNLKIGDKVLLKNRRGENWNQEGKMDRYIGKIVTIARLDFNGFKIEEDDNGWARWNFRFDDIERLANDITLSDLQFADILTLRNGKRYVVADDYMYGENRLYEMDDREIDEYYNNDLTQNENDKDEDIVKVERAGQVIYERQEVVEMTIAEISEKLGCEVKIVKEK